MLEARGYEGLMMPPRRKTRVLVLLKVGLLRPRHKENIDLINMSLIDEKLKCIYMVHKFLE